MTKTCQFQGYFNTKITQGYQYQNIKLNANIILFVKWLPDLFPVHRFEIGEDLA